VGVLMASNLDSPFDLERCGPAVDLALEEVNEFLKVHNVQLRKVQGRYAITLCPILLSENRGRKIILDIILIKAKEQRR